LLLGLSTIIVLILSVGVLNAVVSVYAFFPDVIAVSNPTYPSQVTLGNTVNVGFTVNWYGVPSSGNYFILAGVVDSSDTWVDGTKSSSTPDICQRNTQIHWADCTIASPGADGYVVLDFSIDINQVGHYSYKVAAQIFYYSDWCPPSEITPSTNVCGDVHDLSSTFTFSVVDAFNLTVRAPNLVPVTLDGVQQHAGFLRLTLHPHTHVISVPDIVQMNSTSRLEFSGWSDGSTQLTRTFDLENDTEMEVSYVTQYYVSSTSESTLESGWYNAGTVLHFSVNQTQPWNDYRVATDGFDGWYSNGQLISKSQTASPRIDGPVILGVKWSYLPYIPPIIITTVIIVGVTREVGERRRMREELLKSKRLAAVGEAAAMVGHDLRNPLQAMVTIVYLVKKLLSFGGVEERNKAFGLLEELNDQVHYMDKIVSDLQDYTRPIGSELIETNLSELIREVIASVKIPGTVKVSNMNGGDPRKAILDPVLLRRVLANLVLNAIQAMPKGGELIITTNKTQDSVEIIVQDTGVGIASENLEKIFNPFFTTKAQGQGLGLAVCKRLVEAQGGEITVKSELGNGSTFTVSLPIK